MAISEQRDHSEKGESDTDTYDSYDSEEDPSFGILEETQASFSKLSIKNKAKSGYSISKEMDEETEEDPELIVPELDKKDQKCYEIVQQIIEVGQIDKLKVDQCKLYLRKNGLRLTGNKDTLIGRIKEHLDIANIGGEKKYPASSFIENCKGDACMGDVVMFEQNVYEMFNIASRSANGPPCGTRVVAGRIVKESYGAAKQQHTFTIEVLWSKGEKPLPSLHPLLIKGRNLYKLKTMRQRWQDEGERQKILLEKHTRGSVARLNRDMRIQEKEMRKTLKANRVKTEYQSQKMRENTSKTLPSLPIISRQPRRQPNEQQDLHPTFQSLPINLGKERSQPDMQKTSHVENVQQKEFWQSKAPLKAPYGGTCFFSNANVPPQRVCQRQPLTTMNYNFNDYRQNFNSNFSKSPSKTLSQEQNTNSNQFGVQFRQESTIFNHLKGPVRNHGYQESTSSSLTKSPFRRQMNEQKQLCRYYALGRCYYGDQCKYLHENCSYGQRKNREVRRGGRPSVPSYYY